MGFLEWVQSTDQGLFLFILSFANAVFLPLGPEVVFFPLLVVNHTKLLPYASYCTAGSVLGLMVTYSLAYHWGHTFMEKYIPLNKFRSGIRVFGKYGPWALVVASMFPVFPYRILVILSGFLRQRPFMVFSFLTVGKALRFFGYGFLIAKLGESVLNYLT